MRFGICITLLNIHGYGVIFNQVQTRLGNRAFGKKSGV